MMTSTSTFNLRSPPLFPAREQPEARTPAALASLALAQYK